MQLWGMTPEGRSAKDNPQGLEAKLAEWRDALLKGIIGESEANKVVMDPLPDGDENMSDEDEEETMRYGIEDLYEHDDAEEDWELRGHAS